MLSIRSSNRSSRNGCAAPAGNRSTTEPRTANSPGDYAESYGVGAYDSTNLVASFPGRGPSTFGPIKPVTEPFATSSEQSSTAWIPPKLLLTC